MKGIENEQIAEMTEKPQAPEMLALMSKINELERKNAALIYESAAKDELLEEKSKKLEILEEAHTEMLEQMKKLEEDAYFDKLTGLRNRNFMMNELPGKVAHAERNKEPLSLLMIDLDKFKPMNDRFGHPAGDEVLQTVAKIIMKNIRTEDVAARWGGDEMAILMSDISHIDAMRRAQHICNEINAFVFEKYDGAQIGSSIGVVSSDQLLDLNVKSLVKAADDALYEAKKNRNEVKSYSDIAKTEA